MDLIEKSVAVLLESKIYLEALTNNEYAQEIELMSNSTIGQHTRHFIEFYQCLLSQVNSKNINYCLRSRDHRIEQDTNFAIQTIDQIILQLNGLNLEAPISLFLSKDEEESINSTVAREVNYNIEHCIHHMALIKIGLKIIKPDLELSPSFGVAASTLQHRKAISS